MNIKAQTTLDEKTFQALYKLNMVGTSKPKNRFIFWGVVLAVAVAVVVVEIILSDGATPIMWAVLVILLLFPLLYYRMYKVAPKKRYKKLGAFQDSVNTFHFTDDAVLVTSHNSRGGYLGEATIYYSMLRRVRESDDYFFVYQDRFNVYLVDKSSIPEHLIDDVREQLCISGKSHYKRCKY